MAPFSDEIVYDHMGFQPALIFNDQENPEKYFALWKASFCPKEGFCCFPLEIYVSLVGKIEITNPRDLDDRMRALIKQKNSPTK